MVADGAADTTHRRKGSRAGCGGPQGFTPNRNKGGLPQAATRHRSLVGGPQQVEDRGGREVKERSFLTDRSSSAWLAAMGRPRAFDEDEAVRAAVTLFGGRAYDGVSVDDLVSHLGVHRNSLYKTFGSKRGLYLTALRRHLADDVGPLLDALADAPDAAAALRLVTSADLGLLLLAIDRRLQRRGPGQNAAAVRHSGARRRRRTNRFQAHTREAAARRRPARHPLRTRQPHPRPPLPARRPGHRHCDVRRHRRQDRDRARYRRPRPPRPPHRNLAPARTKLPAHRPVVTPTPTAARHRNRFSWVVTDRLHTSVRTS